MKRFWKFGLLPMAGASLLLLTFASCATPDKRSGSAETQQSEAPADGNAKVVGYDEAACYPTLGPCYGYHPTCWHAWPECCTQCPPPPQVIVTVPEEHAPAVATPEADTVPLQPTPERVPHPPQPNEPQPLPPSSPQPAAPIQPQPTVPVPAPRTIPAAPVTPKSATGSDVQPLDDPSASIAAPTESNGNGTDQPAAAMQLQNPVSASGDTTRNGSKPAHWDGDDQNVPPLPPSLDYLSQSKLQLRRSTSQQ